MKKSKFCITYEIITEESAQYGCSAEHGWWLPGHWEYTLEGPNGRNEQVLADAKAGHFDLGLRTAIRAARDLGATCEIQTCMDWLSARSVDPPYDRANIEDGESRFYTFHATGCSAGTLARIARLLQSH